MKKQLIISIGREFGSGGHEIAQKLAEIYGLKLYDSNLLEHIAEERSVDGDVLQDFDEKKRNYLLSRTVKGMTNSPAENVANLQFDYIRNLAESGESFVIVGRCSESVLKDQPALVSIFVLGDEKCKQDRVARLYMLSKSKALDLMEEQDKKRKRYHNSHCEIKWGDSRGYDISVNSSRLGIDGTVKMLCQYIDARVQQMD